MIITFCGHSQYNQTKADEEKILSLLEKLIGDTSAEIFLGGYGSFDMFARSCASRFQSQHPNTKLILVTPYLTEEYQKNHLQDQKELYDSIVYPPIENVPLRFAILRRNQWMVEQADFVIAFITHTFGGAYKTYSYAKKKKKTVYNISDTDL